MASFSIPCPTSSASLASLHRGRLRSASASASKLVHGFFGVSPPGARSNLQLSSYSSRCRCRSRVPRANALSNEGSVAGAETDGEATKEEPRLPDAPSISAFMNQVADLVELVDSRDIVELQLKQADCEVTIRKKDALQQPPVAAPVYMGPPPSPQHLFPPQPPAAPVLPPAASKPVPSTPTPAAPAVKPSTPSHPPLKCPMAGTFYRSPAPGAPPFVKVGDKVQKGQVVCIIEAMKLMNEIEADQSGTVAEILVEDAKPVSLDTPLFIIAP
ncbi:biotin carboxyl carrier protein of acetyl-CoA carboxylase 2, chloroplastic-like isoform X3 [Eucalyptus grandis]|uniref:biotin carboxyl carrier protein of acetyl-CoA carboxylase 2, chloroplastic-like isoform X3 n=1 Tax=Eucalyptus grandis TaxID=71139 RepID=UPI00192E95F6|nr:biotin carboxyl carrier protein of acetyl-CoA carboxylase 2, chloroplastic-like isoform X3 [Eucalyptus grandis]